MKCALCGFEFETALMACKGCPIAKNCEMYCCPNCGYSYPKETKLVKFLNNLRSGKHGIKRKD